MDLELVPKTQEELSDLIPPDRIAVSEIFYSIQGEGKYSGYPMIFVRLNICHVGCKYCDTKYTWEKITHNRFFNGAELLKALKDINENCKRVCITGGEPLEQADALLEICKHLTANNIKVHLETSGNVLISKEFRDVATWIVCSPKRFYPPNFESPIDEVKMLVTAKSEIPKIKNWVGKFKKKVWVSIQPIEPNPYEFGNFDRLTEEEKLDLKAKISARRKEELTEWISNQNRAIEMCLHTGWQLSLQMHKQLQIR